eukprot:gene5814-8899_t
MLLLEGSHKTIVDNLVEILQNAKEMRLFRCADYHGSQWEVFADGESKIYVSITLHMGKNRLVKWGMVERLADVYGADNIITDDLPEEMSPDPTACIVMEDNDQWRVKPMPKDEKAKLEEICVKYGSLYKNCMWPAFEHHFKRANEDDLFAPVRLGYRPNESMYLQANKDNVSVYYSMCFETEDDLLYGRLFLQEFADSKKHNRNLAGAPSCSFSKERPSGLGDVKNVESEEPHRLWVTFFLFRKHTDTTPAVLENTVDMLLQFRNYVKYHISCSHAYIHSRMRSRHATLLQ